MTAKYLVGDTRDVLATIPDGSVDLIMTSPPFLALRSYLPDDHVDKHREIGSEPDPATFIDTLLALTADWRRVLAPHGSIAIELGDTYSGSGGAGGDYGEGGLRDGQATFTGSAARANARAGYGGAADRKDNARADGKRSTGKTEQNGWPLPKCLALIPELYRIGLAYGRNPLTGTPSPAGRWRVRNVVRWVRPNPPVGALGDKWRPATSDLVVACTATDRYFDLDATRSAGTTDGASLDAPTVGRELVGTLDFDLDATRSAGTTDGASLDAPTVGRELVGTLDAGHGPNVARWWCDLSEAQIAVDGAVARDAQGLEIRQLVGLKVGVETPEGPQMMHLEATRCAASLAGVKVAVLGSLTGLFPVGAPVVDAATSEGGAVLASPVGAAPLAVALKAAEVVALEGALVSGNRLAARLTLKINSSLATAWLIAPLLSGKHPLWHDPIVSEIRSNQGAPPLDWWKISPQGYEGSHYAVYPPELCVKPIEAMCPRRVCRECGKPSRREVDAERVSLYATDKHKGGEAPVARPGGAGFTNEGHTTYTTTGWSSCGCPGTDGIRHDGYHTGTGWRPGLVLDPFGGTGTTGLVATGHGRDAILIDLDPRNVDLARERLGMFLEVDEPEDVA